MLEMLKTIFSLFNYTKLKISWLLGLNTDVSVFLALLLIFIAAVFTLFKIWKKVEAVGNMQIKIKELCDDETKELLKNINQRLSSAVLNNTEQLKKSLEDLTAINNSFIKYLTVLKDVKTQAAKDLNDLRQSCNGVSDEVVQTCKDNMAANYVKSYQANLDKMVKLCADVLAEVDRNVTISSTNLKSTLVTNNDRLNANLAKVYEMNEAHATHQLGATLSSYVKGALQNSKESVYTHENVRGIVSRWAVLEHVIKNSGLDLKGEFVDSFFLPSRVNKILSDAGACVNEFTNVDSLDIVLDDAVSKLSLNAARQPRHSCLALNKSEIDRLSIKLRDDRDVQFVNEEERMARNLELSDSSFVSSVLESIL